MINEEFEEMWRNYKLQGGNKMNLKEIMRKCPLGGDETDDCADCVYACDYHFVNGECVRREEVE